MRRFNIRWQLVCYDFAIFLCSLGLTICFFGFVTELFSISNFIHIGICAVCVFAIRILGRVYQQIWRYGGIQCYIRLIGLDAIAFLVNTGILFVLPLVLSIKSPHISILFGVYAANLLGALVIRMVYRYVYKYADTITTKGKLYGSILKLFAGFGVREKIGNTAPKIKIAIVGAGRVGVSLAEELLSNSASRYVPGCFLDANKAKVDRSIHGIPVLPEDDFIMFRLKELDIKEIVVAIPEMDEGEKKRLHDMYSKQGYKVKVYDYPIMQNAVGKRSMREFDVEELLFRKTINIEDEKIKSYYRDKVILITGGGGSIGSELCRQLAKMDPRKIVVLDIYENGAYDIQQELKILYKGELDISIEIASITNKAALARVFEAHRPNVVINAAAHKHVPLMEKNCIEAVENNVFGTKNLVDLCEEYGVPRFMMVSTDKAVNPTNVMGATKRMCEMIVQCASTYGNARYSATRFGNVLGSAGSVIPLFKRQIACGGPITITDKRIIRYFMTIPEASQLVLESGAIAKNGELFVLDMGQPVKILDLAENMIRLSGVKDIEIVETGLRPGEKLYEELLVKTDELEKTSNKLIFIEHEIPLEKEEVDMKLAILREACESGDDECVRNALKRVVPTFKSMEEVNSRAEESKEMNEAKVLATV